MKAAIFLFGALQCGPILSGQTALDPARVLAQVREKVRATMKNIPKYACTQTIDRSYYAPARHQHGAVPCEQVSGEKDLRLVSTDRLRLEVAEGKEGEIHSWPGAGSFDLTEIDQIVDRGPFGTGSFGGYLLDIFDNGAAHFDYRGEETRGDKRVLVYAYSVARADSHYEIRTYSSWTPTAIGGTFEVDPESLEILRLKLETPLLPVETQLCHANSILDLHRVPIGDGSFLLPRESELHLILRNGQEGKNTTAFSGCREYQAHSAVRFDDARFDAPSESTAKASGAAPKRALPPTRRYELELKINQSIDSDEAAAGDPITATVVHDVHPFQSKDVVIPAGAVAHGRVSRIEHHFLPTEYVVIGIAFQSLEIDGETVPFTARPVNGLATLTVSSGADSGVTAARRGTDIPMGSPTPRPRTPIGPPGSFVFQFAKRHVMAAGTVSQWVTIYPPPK
jgi:hypothetical protein